jgi:type IV secretion system protein VirB10
MSRRLVLSSLLGIVTAVASAQSPSTPPPTATPNQTPAGLKPRPEASPDNAYHIEPGTHILLNMINSVSTKQANVGDSLYLETAFPVLSNGRIVIPQGSWVKGTVTSVKRPGRVKGRGLLQVRFDSLTLPNGVTRDFRADVGSIDARSPETLNKENGKIKSAGDKKNDAETIAGTAVGGTILGTAVGSAAGNAARGSVIGLGAGAATGLLGVLASRGPDAMLTKGSTVEMVLDRPLTFTDQELNFNGVPPRATLSEGGPQPKQRTGFGRSNPF